MNYLRMENLDLAGKRVMIREDLNVPVADGQVTSDLRIRAALPTINLALEKGASVLLLSHLGRPVEGEFDAQFSLRPVASCLEELLGMEVRLETDWLDGVTIEPGEVVLCENVRFNRGEKSNDKSLATTMATLCDVFVMDAFGTAHRAQASTEGVVRAAALACAGPLLSKELDNLQKSLHDPARPMLAIVGGSKVSTKLNVLDASSKTLSISRVRSVSAAYEKVNKKGRIMPITSIKKLRQLISRLKIKIPKMNAGNITIKLK